MNNTHAKPIRWAAMWLLTLMAMGLCPLFSSGMTSPLFACALAEEQDAQTAYEQDGTKIETFDVQWLTQSSTKDNEGNAYSRTDQGLFLATASDTPLSMQFQVSVALSGQHDYAPGEVKIRIPAQIWHPRKTQAGEDGKLLMLAEENTNAYIGGMSLSVPQAPTTQTGYHWTLVGNEYIITNTQTLSAATHISFQFTINGIVPHMIVDRSTAELAARCEVKTARGNTLTRQSNTLTAEIDTIEQVKQAAKNGSVYEDRPTAVSDAMLPAGMNPDDYIYVQWMTYVRHEGNQPFSLRVTDTPSNQVELSSNAGTSEKTVTGVLLGGRIGDRELSAADLKGENGAAIVTDEYCTTKNYDHMVSVFVAYPKADLPAAVGSDGKPVSYTLKNTANWTLTELDPAVGSDEKKVTTQTAEGRVVYTPVAWQEPTTPTGGNAFSHVKKNKDVSDYGYALNQLLDGKAVEHTYLLAIGGYGYSYTKDESQVSGEDKNVPEAYGWKPWSQSVTDETLTLNDRILSAGDYEFTQAIIGVPDVSAWKKLSSGGYAYVMDGTMPKPSLKIEYKVQGGDWQTAAIARWGEDSKKGFEFIQVAAGVGTDTAARKLTFPAGTTGLRASYTSNVFDGEHGQSGQCETAAVNWVITPTVRIKPSEANVAAALEYSRAGMSATLKNRSAMEATQEKNTLSYKESTATTTLSSARYGVRLDKSLKSWSNDVERQLVTLRYSATMTLQTNLVGRDEYDAAVSEGIIPEQQRGVWYDLLPPGATPVLSTVKLREGDAITNVYTLRNFRGTGRVMLVVEANLTPTPVFATSNLGGQVRGFADKPTLSFDVLYPWTACNEYGKQPRNDIAFESLAVLPDGQLGTMLSYQGEPDNPLAGKNRLHAKLFDLNDPQERKYAEALTDLDPGSDEGRFVYAKTVNAISPNMQMTSGLSKQVASPVTGEWTGGLDGQVQATVTAGEIYTYRLRVSCLQEQGISGIVLYDSLERFAPSEKVKEQQADAKGIADKKSWSGAWNGEGQWRGTLVSVDLNDLIAHGIAPVLYYSTKTDLEFTDLDSGATSQEVEAVINSGSYLLTDTSVWTRAEAGEDGVFAVPEGVTAIAVDARKAEGGDDYKMDKDSAIQVHLNMRAPDGDEAEDAYARAAGGGVDWTQALNAANNMYAFNNARYVSVTNGDLQLAHYDYTRVGIVPTFYQVKKAWNDQSNHDGMRPDRVTVTLMRRTMGSSEPAEVVFRDGKPWTAELDAGNSWTALFSPLPPRDGNDTYVYSVKEDAVLGYTASLSATDSRGQYTLTNTHPNERVSLSGQKLWADDGDAAGARPASVRVTLKRDGKAIKSITVTPDANGEWRYSFDNLDRYAPYTGEPYVYTVEEDDVPKYVSEVSEDFSVITNTYDPYGSLSIEKTLEEGATTTASQQLFTFVVTLTREQTQIDAEEPAEPLPGEFVYTVYDKDGNPIEGRSGTITCGGRLTIKGGERAVITGIPSESGYEVSEEPLSGFTCTSKTGDTGVIRAGETAQASFVNRYSAGVTVPLYVTKRLEGGMIGDGQFRFELRDQDGNMVSTATTGAGAWKTGEPVLTSEATAYFGRLSFTHADDGKSYVYTVREVDDGQTGYTYDTTTQTVTITLHDNGDGTMDYKLFENGVELNNAALATFRNSYQASGSVTLRAWKALHGRALEDKEFSFALYEYKNGNIVSPEVGVVTNDANGEVGFPALSFDQTKLSKEPTTPAAYTYLMCEVPGDDQAVDYTQDAYLVTLTVTDAGEGRLNIEQTAMKKAAVLFDGQTPSKVFAYALCVPCGGTGVLSTCTTCGGTGKTNNNGADCATCNGTGKSTSWTCTFCGGTGQAATDVSNARPYSGAPVFSNALKPGKLSVTKHVPQTEETPADQTFRFHLKLTGESIPETIQTADGRTLTAEGAQASVAAAAAPAVTAMQGAQSAQPVAQSLLRAAPAPLSEGEDGGSDPKADDPDDEDDDAGDGSALLASGVNLLGEGTSGTLEGNAYARLDKDSGEMVFFRSSDGHDFQNIEMPEDASWEPWGDTNQNKGKRTETESYFYFKDFEETKHSHSVNTWPWKNKQGDVRKVIFKGRIQPASCVGFFANMSNLTSIEGLQNLDTSRADNMRNMFNGCSSLTSLDLSSFDTGNVTTVQTMFKGCSSLVSLNLSSFNTSKVASMLSMFDGCSNLKSIELGPLFDTSSVTNMYKMFWSCKALIALDVSAFNTGNVTTMESMFSQCENLTSLNLRSFDTKNVESMSYMFNNCKSLTSLDLSSFTTDKVGNFENMFSGCQSLQTLNMIGFHIMQNSLQTNMFDGCKKINRITISNETVMQPNVEKNYPRIDENSKEINWVNVATGTNMYSEALFTTDFTKFGTWVRYVAGYTLLFDANGGTGTMAAVKKKTNEGYSFNPAGQIVNRGYTLTSFTATVLGKDYTFPVGEDGSVVIPAPGDDWNGLEVILYAQWEKNTGEPTMESREFVFELTAGKTIELMNLPGGAAYEIWEDTTAGWTMTGSDNLNGTIAANDTTAATVTNAYTPDEVSYVLRASKTMDGRPATANEFSFTLTETTEGAANPWTDTKATNAGGAVVFDTITQTYAPDDWTDTMQKVYTYRIEEIDKTKTTIDYDPSVYTATVTVSKNSEGKLSAEVTYAKDGDTQTTTPPTFANKTMPGSLVIEKKAAGAWTDAARTQEFTFDVTLMDSLGRPCSGAYGMTTAAQDGSGASAPSTLTLSGGKGTLTLRAGQKATISGLPAGISYTVTEREKPGFTLATARGATGAITAAGTATATFANSYEAKGVANIEVKKALVGRTLAENQFEFDLYEADENGQATGNPIQTARNAADGTVRFAPLSYTAAGTYHYVIREIEGTDPSIAYSDQALSVTVVMRDLEGKGSLTAVLVDADGHVLPDTEGKVTITGGDGEQHDTITNRVKTGELEISKTVEPEAAGENKEFTFTLTLKDASGSPLIGSYKAVRGTEDLTLTPNEQGVCLLTLAHGQRVTISDLPEGATYAVAETATPGYAISSTGEAGTITADATAQASFTNTYSAKGSYPLTASKTLTGGEMTAGQFRFVLEELNADGSPTGEKKTAVNDANGCVTLTLDFTDADLGGNGTLNRRYRLSEINDSAVGYVYDPAVYTVALTVQDNKDGTLRFTPEFKQDGEAKNAIVFANSYSNSIDMSATKVWQGDEDDQYHTRRNVTLTLQQRIGGSDWSKVAGSAQTIPADAPDGGRTVTWDKLPRFDEYGKTIEYRVVETMPDYADGLNPYACTVTGNAETGFTVTNRYARAALTLAGSKTLSGRSLVGAPAFHFVLKQGDTVLQTAQNDASGKFAFDPLVYTLADLHGTTPGTDGARSRAFTYTVSEQDERMPGYTYDSGAYAVTVTLTEDANGVLRAEVTGIEKNGAPEAALAFANAYHEGSLEIAKTITADGSLTQAAQNQTFGFAVTLLKEDRQPWSGQPVQVGSESQTTDAQGQLTVTMKGGEHVCLNGIPAGISYQVEEKTLAADAPWELVKKEYDRGAIVADQTPRASFENRYLNQTQITATKVWQGDENNQYDTRRDVTLTLQKRIGGSDWSEVDGSEKTIPAAATGEGLKVTWTGLPCFEDDGGRIEYRVVETMADYADGANPYESVITGDAQTGFTVTNTLMLTSFTVYKQWRGEEGGPISLTLYANGERLDPQPACRRAGNTYTYDQLPLFDGQGTLIVYSAKEAYMEGYMTIYCNRVPYSEETRMIYDGGTIVNKAVTDFRVQKVWVGLSPEMEKPRITLTLLCNGQPVDRDTPVPDRDGWYRYTNLPAYVNGERAVYTAVEAPMPSCVTAYAAPDGSPADCARNGYTITNTYLPKTGDRSGMAAWLALGMISALGALLLAWRRRRG